MKLIDKDALVAEIKKCYNECLKRAKITDSGYWNAKADAYRNVWVILNDTLEVKEVDLEKGIQDIFQKYKNGYNGLIICNKTDFSLIAKHFFELGLAQKGEEV